MFIERIRFGDALNCLLKELRASPNPHTNLPALGPQDVSLELRPLPSAGITRLRWYYGPLRHPKRPGLSLAGVRLAVTRGHRGGFPCGVRSPCADMPSPRPRRDRWMGSVRSPDTSDSGLPRRLAGSAPALVVSRPAQRSRRLRPACSRSRLEATLSTGGFGKIVTSLTAPIATGWSGSCQVGIAPTEERRLCTAH